MPKKVYICIVKVIFWSLPVIQALFIVVNIAYPPFVCSFLPDGAFDIVASTGKFIILSPLIFSFSAAFSFLYQMIINLIANNKKVYFILLLLQAVSVFLYYAEVFNEMDSFEDYIWYLINVYENVPYFCLSNLLLIFVRKLETWSVKTSLIWDIQSYCLPIYWCLYKFFVDLVVYSGSLLFEENRMGLGEISLRHNYVYLFLFASFIVWFYRYLYKEVKPCYRRFVFYVLTFFSLCVMLVVDYYMQNHVGNFESSLVSSLVYILPFFILILFIFIQKDKTDKTCHNDSCS